MSIPLIVKQLEIPDNRRVIVISDIHGELDLFKKLLDKVNFCDDDILVILGDFYLKGSQPEESFHYVMELNKQPNVHVLRGNCEWGRADFYTDEMWDWVCNLPIIIESEKMIFVHAALEDKPLDEQDVIKCLTTYDFMNVYDGKPFDKWVIVGHWPVAHYHHATPCFNPVINDKNRIISIDGGYPVCKYGGQQNALIVENGKFSWEFAENYPTKIIESDHEGNEGTLNISFLERFVEIVEHGEEFSRVKHQSGEIIEVPTDKIWQEDDGRNCIADMATNHHLSVKKGDTVSVVAKYSNKFFGKKDGIAGWINL
ncbi:MAG: metallophosphoesterase [Defluviitaleaceae bacterium]|nr:metallophosphoesterase [Defluviitaleaceae bacterium]